MNLKEKNLNWISTESLKQMDFSRVPCEKEGLVFNPNFFFPLLLDVLAEGTF